jgi:hypothetical protein
LADDFACKTIDPNDPNGPRIEVIFPGSLTLRYYKYAPVRYWNLIAAKHVLELPERIFWGVREYNEGGWCYVGKPAEWYVRENVKAPFPGNKVFAVYINPLMRVYECRAEYAAEDDRLCPVDWENRYRGLIWKSTS